MLNKINTVPCKENPTPKAKDTKKPKPMTTEIPLESLKKERGNGCSMIRRVVKKTPQCPPPKTPNEPQIVPPMTRVEKIRYLGKFSAKLLFVSGVWMLTKAAGVWGPSITTEKIANRFCEVFENEDDEQFAMETSVSKLDNQIYQKAQQWNTSVFHKFKYITDKMLAITGPFGHHDAVPKKK